MKKLTLFMAASFIAAMALTGCAPSTESSDWLKGTTWKADLAGNTVIEELNGRSIEQTVREGTARIRFTGGGYIMRIDIELGSDEGDSSSALNSQQITRVFPDYAYPELFFPFPIGETKDDPTCAYSTGIISEDFKSIHFESFILSRFKSGPSFVAKNITFTR